MVLAEIFFLFFYALTEAGIWALCSTGLNLVFGTMRIFNLAAGDLMMVGGYITYWLYTLYGVDPFLSIFIVMVIHVLIGFSTYFLFKPIRENETQTLLLGYGTSIFIMSTCLNMWKPDIRLLLTNYSFLSFSAFGFMYNVVRLVALVISLIVILTVNYYLSKAMLGKAIRAIVQDRDSSALMGVNILQVECATFSLATLLMGVGGILFTLTHYLHPSIGPSLTIRSFCIIVLGGMGRIKNVLFASIVLGLIETFCSRYITVTYKDAIALLVLLIVLLVKSIKTTM